MTEPWLSYISAVEDAYLAIWAEELAGHAEDWRIEVSLARHLGEPGLAGLRQALAEPESWHAKLRAYLSSHDDPGLARARKALSAVPSWEDQLRACLGCLDDPGSAGFRAALAEIGLRADGRFEPNGSIGVATAGYTAPWGRQAPWDISRAT